MSERIRNDLEQILSPDDIIDDPGLLTLYEADSQRIHTRAPDLALHPRDEEQLAKVVQLAGREGIPLTARGAGTGLSGGAVPLAGGWLISFTRMNQVISIDAADRSAWVRPGVVNGELQTELQPLGLQFSPDPSSQNVSTLGGNVAENAGGPHCFRIGVTTQHILGLEIVDDRGEIHRLCQDAPGGDPLDAVGLVTGSEGTLALVTAIQLRLSPLPEAVVTILAPFSDLVGACDVVGEFIQQGLSPSAMEILDRETIRAVEGSVFRAGYPPEAEAVLLVEVDGIAPVVADERVRVRDLLRQKGALWIKEATDPAMRLGLWRGRKGAFGAVGRLYRDISVQDICVPVHLLPDTVRGVSELSRKFDLPVACVFHAGDGNLHPNIGFDREDPAQVERLHRFTTGLMALALKLGGTLSGEHGVGVEKADHLPLALPPEDRKPMLLLKSALDPSGLLNPGKIFPAGDQAFPLRGALRLVTRPSVRDEGGEVEFFRPESEEELVVILEESQGRDKLIYPSGARLLDEVFDLPGPVHRILSTASLRGVKDIDRRDFTVRVGAGTPWTELESLLAGENMQLDWEIPRPELRSIGGVTLCDESWPWRSGQSNPRDRLLGLRGLLSDGGAFSAGGRVMKNVTGYDLPRLLAGSRGALAVVTELQFRASPLVELKSLLLLSYPEKSRALRGADLLFTRLDYGSGLVLVPPGSGIPGIPSAWTLALALDGGADQVRHWRRHCLDLLAGAGVTPEDHLHEEGGDLPCRLALRDFPTLSDTRGGCYLYEFRDLPHRLFELLPYLGSRWVLDIPGHRLRLGSDDPDFAALLPPELAGCYRRRAGLNGRGDESPSRFSNLSGLPFLERIAQGLDPGGRLAPGRWLFG